MTAAAIPAPRPSRLALLLELTKFRISAASTFTASMGYIAWRRGVDGGLVSALLGTLLLAMAASALNEVQERGLDALMPRTQGRPLPRGLISPAGATLVAALLAVGGAATLWAFHGWTPALLGLLALGWYNAFYTPLKRRSAFAVVPGSVIGALPPAIGWTAAGGDLGHPAMAALCFVFFVWQVPHFWLLSLLHAEDYEKAGFPTLTRHFDRDQILRLTFTWTCGTVAASALLPLFRAARGPVALALLGLASLWLVYRFTRLLRPNLEASDIRRAFMEINAYALALMAAVITGSLG